MTHRHPSDERSEEWWRDYLTHPDTKLGAIKNMFGRLPSSPRCQLCHAPFTGAGGSLMRLIGKRQSTRNRTICNTCEKELLKHHGGAEVDSSFLFADIRGSTALAETMSTTAFRGFLDRFYTVAADVVMDHAGQVDKFVGDELVAAFPPMLSADHPANAVAAARSLLEATGHDGPDGPWVPLGAGVHTGRAWFGTIGEGTHVEITAVGDTVNTTARLAAAAASGEILVSADAAAAAGLPATLERRSLDLKGKAEPFEVVSLRIGSNR
jgi:adenylate cyclase